MLSTKAGVPKWNEILFIDMAILFWVYEFNGLARTRAVILMISGFSCFGENLVSILYLVHSYPLR